MIYKNKFVALYDSTETCVFVADNWPELARYLGKTVQSVQTCLCRILNDKTCNKNFICNGKKLTPYLISLEEE